VKVSVFNKYDVVNYQPSGLSAIIRIADTFNFNDLKGNYDSEIQFFFSDIEDELSDYAISEEEAKDLAKFIKTLKHFNEIVVHCEYGQGRSPAVAYVISEYYGLPFDISIYPNVNKLVISKLKEALNIS